MKRCSRRWTVLVAIVAPMVLTATAAVAGGEVDVLFGQKQLSDGDLEDLDVDGQTQFGVAVTLDFDWPVALAIDVLSSSDDSTFSETFSSPGYAYSYEYRIATDVDTLELQLGVRKFWGERVVPYVGGGLSYVQLEGQQVATATMMPGPGPQQFTLVDDTDGGVGYWLNAGVDWRFAKRFTVGLDVRYSDASATLRGEPLSPGEPPPEVDLDSGGTHIGVAFGYRW